MDRNSFTLAALFVAYMVLMPSTGTTISTEPSYVVLPDSEGNVQSFVFLFCYVDPAPAPSQLTSHRWILPSGGVVSDGLSGERHTGIVSPTTAPNGTTQQQQLILLIERLTYSDAGTYVCEFDDNGQTMRASTDLVLEVDLQVLGNENVAVMPGTSQVGFNCEMSLYLHPDEDLQWFHDGKNISDTDRHTVSYIYSSGVGQFGGQDTGPSRVINLLISEPQMSDSGRYTCAIRGTNVSQDIQLSFTAETDPPTPTDHPPPTDTPETIYAVDVLEIGSPPPSVPPGAFSSFRTLGCFVSPSVYKGLSGPPTVPDSSLFQSQWILPNESALTFSQGRFDLFFFREPEELPLVMNITRVSYADEGVYTCRFRDASGSTWFSNTTELLLSVNLEAYDSEISTFDNTTGVSLSCEMSLYLRPDEDLQWFRDGQSITSGSGRHSITYTDGSGEGQFGGDAIGSSRISTLVISQPQTTDSGTYTCAIRNNQHSQDIELAVENSAEDTMALLPSSSSSSNAAETPSATQSLSMSTPSNSPSNSVDDSQLLFLYIGSGAALLIIVVVLTATVLCIAVMMFKKGESKKPAAVDPVYDYIPEEGHDSRAHIMLGANVAYDRKPEEKTLGKASCFGPT